MKNIIQKMFDKVHIINPSAGSDIFDLLESTIDETSAD